MTFGEAQSISEFLMLWLTEQHLPSTEQEILRSYYASYCKSFPARTGYYYDRQVQEVMEIIRKTYKPRVLEVGCGCGTESLGMASHGADVDAVDLNEPRLRVANRRKRVLEQELGRQISLRFRPVSVLELDSSEGYEVIWMEQAFHHLEPRDEIVDKLVNLLKPNGYLIVAEANALNPLLQLQLFLRRGFQTKRVFVDHRGKRHLLGIERILSAHTLRRLFTRRGIVCRGISYFRVFPNHRFFSHLWKLEEALPISLTPLFTHYNYVGQKALQRPG